jgi:hypothetical protein
LDLKLGFKIVIYLLILNCVSGLIYTVSVPGTAYSYAMHTTPSGEDFEENFNSTEFMQNQQPGIISDFPFLGNIYGTIMMLWNAVNFVIMGFPTLLEQLGGFIPEAGSGKAAYTAICWVLRALFSLIIFGWLFQLITGRQVED